MFIKHNLLILNLFFLLLHNCFISSLNTKITSIDSSYNSEKLLLQTKQSDTTTNGTSSNNSQQPSNKIDRKQLLKQKQKSTSDQDSLLNKLNKVKNDLKNFLQDNNNEKKNQQFNQYISDTLDKAESELKDEFAKFNNNKDVNDYYSDNKNLENDFIEFVKAFVQDSNTPNNQSENEKTLLDKLNKKTESNQQNTSNVQQPQAVSLKTDNETNDDSSIDKILDEYESKLEKELSSLDGTGSNGLFSSLSDSFKASVESNTNAKKNIIKRILGFEVPNESPEETQEKAKALKKKKLIAEIGLAIFLKKEEQDNIIYHVNTKNKLKTKTHPFDKSYDELASNQNFIDWKKKFFSNDHKDLFENEEDFNNTIRSDYSKIINKLKSLSIHGNAQMS